MEILLGAAAAAAAGTLFRLLAGEVAKRAGHSRESGERAAATGGISLVVHPNIYPSPESEEEPMFAKTSSPLAKLVRTTEGVLVVLFNVAIVAAAVAGKIAPGTAAQYAGILNSVTVVSRSGLKAVAALAAAQAAQPQAPAHAEALAELVPVGEPARLHDQLPS